MYNKVVQNLYGKFSGAVYGKSSYKNQYLLKKKKIVLNQLRLSITCHFECVFAWRYDCIIFWCHNLLPCYSQVIAFITDHLIYLSSPHRVGDITER
jgi:hypothetical protein